MGIDGIIKKVRPQNDHDGDRGSQIQKFLTIVYLKKDYRINPRREKPSGENMKLQLFQCCNSSPRFFRFWSS